MYYVYILQRSEDNNLYVGYTGKLEDRLKQHRQLHPNYRLIYYETYLYKEDATKREKRLKYYGSAWRALKKRISA